MRNKEDLGRVYHDGWMDRLGTNLIECYDMRRWLAELNLVFQERIEGFCVKYLVSRLARNVRH